MTEFEIDFDHFDLDHFDHIECLFLIMVDSFLPISWFGWQSFYWTSWHSSWLRWHSFWFRWQRSWFRWHFPDFVDIFLILLVVCNIFRKKCWLRTTLLLPLRTDPRTQIQSTNKKQDKKQDKNKTRNKTKNKTKNGTRNSTRNSTRNGTIALLSRHLTANFICK